MTEGKMKFIECSRLQNEIRIEKMKEHAFSPSQTMKPSRKVKSMSETPMKLND